MAELTRAGGAPSMVADAWIEQEPRSGHLAPGDTRLFRHRRVIDAVAQLASEPVDDATDARSYLDEQLAALGDRVRVIDRRDADRAGQVRLSTTAGGLPVTTDLLVRVDAGRAELCAVTRATARDVELVDDVAAVVAAWSVP